MVTGAAGFIGRALVERFQELGSEVRGVDLIEAADEWHLVADITTPGNWQGHAEGCDLVIHTAAVVGMYSSREGYWETNVVAPRHVMDAAIAAGAKRFVHLSSIVVFGFDFEGVVDERSPVRPNGVHYVDTKIASEQVVLEAHAEGEIPCTIVRPGDVYGPGSRPWTVEPIRLLKAKQLILPDGGRGLHSPVYVDDLVDGIVRGGDDARGRGTSLHSHRRRAADDRRVPGPLLPDARHRRPADSPQAGRARGGPGDGPGGEGARPAQRGNGRSDRLLDATRQLLDRPSAGGAGLRARPRSRCRDEENGGMAASRGTRLTCSWRR